MTESGTDPTQVQSENSLEDPGNPQVELPENQNSNLNRDGPGSTEEIIVTPLEEPEYQHPHLKGKTPAEIDALVTTMQETLEGQNTELNARVEPQPTAPTPVQSEVEEPADYGDDFLSPRFQQLDERVTDKLTKALTRTIAPLLDKLDRGSAVDARAGLKTRLKHFTALEPYIDKMLRDSGMDPSTVPEDKLETVYMTALGFAQERGINLTGGTTTPTEGTPVNIPQHRPSAAPIPQAPVPPRRVLDENEKLVAKQMFPNSQDPEGDWIKGLETPEDGVVSPGFSEGGK